MEPISDDELRLALEGLRPEPRPAFAAELDARVASGFPRRSRARRLSPAFGRLRAVKPRQVLMPAVGVAATVFLIAGIVAAQMSGGGSDSLDSTSAEMTAEPAMGEEEAGTMESGAMPEALHNAAAGKELNFDGSGGYVRGSANLTNLSMRQVERTAEMTLGTEPENVGKVSSQVFDVVAANRGIVLSSSTRQSAANGAAAQFHLLIPSGKLGNAMAGLSEIAEVRARREATADITAPTVGAAEHLEDSQARIDSLLTQLSEAETEGEREAVEAELRGERNRAAVLRAQLQRLEQRADYSHVWLRVETGEPGAASDEGGAWGIGDAFDDAGQILGVTAAVALLALAVLGPLALIALLIWLARRSYIRRSRQTALG